MEDEVSVQSPGIDKVLGRLLNSTVGLKALVAVTGAALVGFVFVHMVGHLQMFEALGGRDGYNAYAHKLQSLGGIKWAVRLGLLGMVVVHVVATLKLIARNRAARPVAYGQAKWLAASLGAQTMRVTGPLLLVFIVYHLLHFTVMCVTADGYQNFRYVLADSHIEVADAYQRMIVAFTQPLLTVAYVVAMILLGTHLSHGISSLFQTLGLNNSTYRPAIRKVGPLLAGAVVAGFCVVPLAILAGVIQ